MSRLVKMPVILLMAALGFTSSAVWANEALLLADTALKSPSAFEHLSDKAQFSKAIFKELGKVITHPRCVNCHGANDRPSQGDDMVEHQPPVQRGPNDMGVPGMICTTCHGAQNVQINNNWSMPGHSPWIMAPASQVWQGKTLAQICQQLKDPTRSHMSLDEIVSHFAQDGLVGWGWDPGAGREKAPGTQKQAGDLARAWVDSGAHCPES